jgi:dGTPase
VLRLNEDLAEAVALGLNLGAPPFGGSGADVLGELLSAGDPEHPGYDPAGQALRVVDLLEKRYAHPGLNLCHEVREGLAKYRASALPQDPELDCRDLWPGQAPSPEAQLAYAADRLAALVHDIEDGLRAGTVAARRLERLGAVREVSRLLGSQLAPPRESFLRGNQLLRGMLHLFVVGLVERTAANIDDWCGRHDVRGVEAYAARRQALQPDLVALSPATAGLAREAEDFVATSLHNSAQVRRAAYRAAHVLRFLIVGYTSDPRTLPDHALLAFRFRARVRFLRDVPPAELASEIDRRYRQNPAFRRFLADFLAGMSDRFAAEEARRLGGPDSWRAST